MADFSSPKIVSKEFIANGVTFPSLSSVDGYSLIQPGVSIESNNTVGTFGIIQGVFIDNSGVFQMIIGDSYNP